MLTIVFVVGGGVRIMVWMIVEGAGTEPSSPVPATGPPSTATTEYVALGFKGAGF